MRTNDWVLLSWAEALLKDAGLTAVVLDTHQSIMDGSIGAIPRRLMTAEADADKARLVLREAGALG